MQIKKIMLGSSISINISHRIYVISKLNLLEKMVKKEGIVNISAVMPCLDKKINSYGSWYFIKILFIWK